jgi:transcriptional antiterminator RfaH
MTNDILGLDTSNDIDRFVESAQAFATSMADAGRRDPQERVREAPSWFVLKCRLRDEPRVVAQLAGGGFEAFLPQCRVRRRIPGSVRIVTEPLFPGFVFVRVAPDSCDWAVLRCIPGVHNVLRFGGFAPRVPQAVIERLIEVDGIELDGPGGRPQDGDLGRMAFGSLPGLEALFLQREGPARGHLLQEFMRRLSRSGGASEVIEAVG